MADARSLAFCLDETFGPYLAEALRRLRAPMSPNIKHLKELGHAGKPDEMWLSALTGEGFHAVLTCDSKILRAALRRDVWKQAGLSLFILERSWGNLSLFEKARGVFWWWPALVAQSVEGPQGGAWLVPMLGKPPLLKPHYGHLHVGPPPP